jgi:hypothetical protein
LICRSVKAGEDRYANLQALAALVIENSRHDDDSRRALRLKARDLEHRINRVVRKDAAQELGANLRESDQGRPDHMREETRPTEFKIAANLRPRQSDDPDIN